MVVEDETIESYLDLEIRKPKKIPVVQERYLAKSSICISNRLIFYSLYGGYV